jgi:tetratricopeptide (TPR) repeat protein
VHRSGPPRTRPELLAPREALAHLERAIELFDSVPDAASVAGLDAVELHRRAAGYADRCGRVERAVALAREALRRAEGDGDPGRVALLHHRLAQHLIAAERVAEALPHAEQAVAGLSRRPPAPPSPWTGTTPGRSRGWPGP